MPRPDRSVHGLAARGLVAALVLLAAAPAYLALDRPWRAAVLRLVCGAVVAAAGVRMLRGVSRASGAHAVSPLDAAPPAVAPPLLDARFGRLRDDIISSARSRRYFDVVLWPRLSALAPGRLVPPEARRILRRRGPSLRALDRLVAEVDERP